MDDAHVLQTLQRGLACQQRGQWEAAATEYLRVLDLRPGHARALHLLGLVRASQGHSLQAKTLLAQAVQADPSDVTPVSNLAKLLLSLNELGGALKVARSGMAIKPGFLAFYLTEAAALQALGHPMDALSVWEEARMIDPLSPEAVSGVANVLAELGLAEQPSAAGLDVLHRNGFYLRTGERLYDAGVYSGALSCLRACLIRQPENKTAHALHVLALMHACEWDELDREMARMERGLQTGDAPVPPFALLALADNPAQHLRRAQSYFGSTTRRSGIASSVGKSAHPPGVFARLQRRCKVAYVSGDFHDHATSRLMVGMLEQHDRSRWEIMGVSLGPDEDTAMRRRVSAAFEHFVDVRNLSDREVAQHLKDWGADIVIDVKGLTEGAREQIFLQRPAPIVVNFLAYPGSMGTPACDYILGDAVVTPFEDAAHYTEHIVQLPGSYQCNDNSRPEVPPSAERALHGLPAEAIVFAAFNNSYKINRTVFSSWMRILLQVPDSVLWLTCDDALARTNLWRNAERSGVSPERLVFAPRLPWAAHLARMACADLLLDTWPYNAHTTASDALWAGVPVLTRAGRSFASRVASSLLISIGLPELICADETAYEAAAVQWASDRESLRSLRARLLLLKKESPLFDAHRFARNLEQAWTCMWYRHLCRLPPHAFAVRDVAEGGGVCWSDQTEWSPLPDLFSSLP